LSLLHIPAIVVHGNALTLDVWGLWYTPAHVLGGWGRKLERRVAQRAVNQPSAPEVVQDVEEIPADLLVHASEPSGDDVATVVERPFLQVATGVVSAAAPSLLEMFEESATASNASAIFTKIEQLALF
jgi:hypothetical protein